MESRTEFLLNYAGSDHVVWRSKLLGGELKALVEYGG
jgi:hypothetical protein